MSALHLHLCFVRHAETEANAAGIRQGHSDYPLTEAGMLGARRLGGALRDCPWNLVMCSDLLRTRKTLGIIQEQRRDALEGVAERFSAVLREVNFGIREGLPKETTVEEAKLIWSNKHGVAVESITDPAESEAAVLARQEALLAELHTALSPLHAGPEQPARVLCVSHGGFIRRFLNNFTDCRVDVVPNCSVTRLHIEYSPVPDDGPPQCVCKAVEVCDTSHLQPSSECDAS